MQINLPEDFGYVGIGIVALTVVQYGLGARAMSLRYYFKTPEFLNNPQIKQLQEEHKKAFGTEINNFGYPDMGNGRYFQALPYEYWVKFNNYQRAHYNMVESSAGLLACTLFGGLLFPKLSGALAVGNAISRVIYAVGYTTKGADGRLIGATIGVITYALLVGTSIYTSLILMKIV